jgi:hypothetical protein
MEYFTMKQTTNGLHVEGFPDAEKLIKIKGKEARRLADLALHKADLDFAHQSLEGLNLVPSELWVLRQALWRSAIIHYIKCFGSSEARFQLSAAKIYNGNKLALDAFAYFKDIRRKHIVHDENSYSQSIPSAVLNKKESYHKIEKIICLSIIADTLDKDSYSNFSLLISDATKWVIK